MSQIEQYGIDESLDLPEQRPISNILGEYLQQVTIEEHKDNGDLQQHIFNHYGDRTWGSIIMQLAGNNDFDGRLNNAIENPDKMKSLMNSIVTRGVELISGGVISSRELTDGDRRGLIQNGTWPDSPSAHFWSPRDQNGEKTKIQSIVSRVLDLETDASTEHVGRVLTMSLPALISWADISGLVSESDIVETIQRMFDAEKTGHFDVVTFGCEPYEYEHNPNTTTSHLRRSLFENEDSLRRDAIQGSFRAVRRILDPLTLSGVDTQYQFYTSFGTSWDLIQRQVMPDTINQYRSNPQEMLNILDRWRTVIQLIGEEEFQGSQIRLQIIDMESQVVAPAMDNLAALLYQCGVLFSDSQKDFYAQVEQIFDENYDRLGFEAIIQNHPNPPMLIGFIQNEDEWSLKHSDKYKDEKQRKTLARLLAFFEYYQYYQINELINKSDLALGVEIDEELIDTIRSEQGSNQTPLVWGRPPKFTQDGIPGGVAHRQPWFYADGRSDI